ncbi:MAG TPA: Lsr2 family protein [Pseudonocardiaceae bacterium]|nr:Lsr2 family protein [Pseudonocardiaceae bacterium]
MASKTVVELFDDLDGGRANETVGFALDGVEYEIDLSSANAARLRDMLADYIAHGHRVSGRSRSMTRSSAGTGVTASASAGAVSGRSGSRRKGKPRTSNADMTAEIRRLASESARKVSEANQAAAAQAEDDEADLFSIEPEALAERQSQGQPGEQVGPMPALIIPFQEAGL